MITENIMVQIIKLIRDTTLDELIKDIQDSKELTESEKKRLYWYIKQSKLSLQ